MKYFITVGDFIYYNRKLILFILVVFLLAFGTYYLYSNGNEYEINSDISSNSLEIDIDDNEVKEQNIIEETLYVVDIKGNVKNPGIYEVSDDFRVMDVINLAGGINSDGDLSNINLSKKISDEMVIIVPSKKSEIVSSSFNIKNEAAIDNSDTNSSGQVSINNATIDELMSIKGVGEVKAKSIIEYRNTNGLFKEIEDIKKVKGIGDSTFEKIKDYIKL